MSHGVVRFGEFASGRTDAAVHSFEVWRMSDVKTIKRKNPYKLELKPFRENGYGFEILRQGVSPSEFEFITARIADSRATR